MKPTQPKQVAQTKIKLYMVQFTKTVTEYVIATDQKDLKKAIGSVELFDLGETPAKITGCVQMTGKEKVSGSLDVYPWFSEDLAAKLGAVDCDTVATILRKMRMLPSIKKGAK